MDVGDLDDDPLRQLSRWQEAARRSGEPMVEAMCVATASTAAEPSARMVLLRGLDTGLVFFTDYASAKGVDLAANPRAAALFHWYRPIHRQIRVSGPVSRTTAAESDAYWATRPPASRRSAVASHQSAVLSGRAALDETVAALGETEPVRPERWGGYRIVPEVVEFWEERPDRLHDRIRFTREGPSWRVDRLSP